eukprot:UC4_evm3s157
MLCLLYLIGVLRTKTSTGPDSLVCELTPQYGNICSGRSCGYQTKVGLLMDYSRSSDAHNYHQRRAEALDDYNKDKNHLRKLMMLDVKSIAKKSSTDSLKNELENIRNELESEKKKKSDELENIRKELESEKKKSSSLETRLAKVENNISATQTKIDASQASSASSSEEPASSDADVMAIFALVLSCGAMLVAIYSSWEQKKGIKMLELKEASLSQEIQNIYTCYNLPDTLKMGNNGDPAGLSNIDNYIDVKGDKERHLTLSRDDVIYSIPLEVENTAYSTKCDSIQENIAATGV